MVNVANSSAASLSSGNTAQYRAEYPRISSQSERENSLTYAIPGRICKLKYIGRVNTSMNFVKMYILLGNKVKFVLSPLFLSALFMSLFKISKITQSLSYFALIG